MQRVALSLVKPGMVLAKPILNEDGMPLCAEGTVLSDMLIERLQRMNVTMVTLKGNPVDTGQGVKTPAEKVAEMRQRFVRVADQPRMQRLMAAVEDAILNEGAEETGEDGGDE
ncbi:MAG: hypothetical protein BWY87_00748 [Deltaproteobacteria bacterium ADurb.Bin510]|nr:MAG: hypothetical protein BWY87_00748 [Deltaproteobacteria bacterium ADurb.Bin510]